MSLAFLKSMPVFFLGLIVLLRGVACGGSKDGKGVSRYAWYTGIGLALGSCGDFALQLEHDNPEFFVVGLGFFLVSHLAYIGGFWAESKPGCMTTPSMLAGLVVFAGYAVAILSVLLPVLPEKLRAPVVVYGTVIAVMGFAALGRSWDGASGRTTWWLSFFGALLFVTSDSCLALNKFHPDVNTGRPSVMLTYYAAQLLFALSSFHRAPTASKSD